MKNILIILVANPFPVIASAGETNTTNKASKTKNGGVNAWTQGAKAT